MLASRRSQYLFYFSCFMVAFYFAVGILLAFTKVYSFENQFMIGIALMIYGLYRAARIWNARREADVD